MTRQDAVGRALRALGAAYRGDWSDFDGRSLRHQLEEVADFLADPAPITNTEVEAWMAGWFVRNDICPVGHHWTDHCEPAQGCQA